MFTIGDLFKELRIKTKLTQKEVALQTGFSQAYINKIENNLGFPNDKIIDFYVRQFKLDKQYLIELLEISQIMLSIPSKYKNDVYQYFIEMKFKSNITIHGYQKFYSYDNTSNEIVINYRSPFSASTLLIENFNADCFFLHKDQNIFVINSNNITKVDETNNAIFIQSGETYYLGYKKIIHDKTVLKDYFSGKEIEFPIKSVVLGILEIIIKHVRI